MNNQIEVTDLSKVTPIKDEAERLIELAITKKADVETMSKLMEMRREFKEEKAKESFDRAMANFQKNCPIIEKKKQGYNYKYADLGQIVEQVKDLLADNGFSYSFNTDETEKGLVIYCKIKHIDGYTDEPSRAFIDKETTTKMNSSQQSGLVMTYGKRYAFCNALGILTGDEDNDAASPKNTQETPQNNTRQEETTKTGKCEHCGTTNKYHKPGCPGA